ncbi:hypothetical protein J6590_052413 [Homalodisca vitripennis]|nr:hypothetical protein J6590_052413 [Homalodisca vitripennis]
MGPTHYKTVVNLGSLPVESLIEDCLHNVLLVDKQDCRWLLSPTMPLSVLHNFYVVMVENWSWETMQCSEQFGPARVVFVLLREARVFSLSSPLVRPRQIVPSETTVILEEFKLTRTKLNGTEIKIATFHCPPFVIFVNGNGTSLDSIIGNEWEIIKALYIHFNFSVKLVPLKGNGKWGRVRNGTAVGGVAQALAEHNADIGVCNLWNVRARYSVSDFSPMMNEVTFTYIVPRPSLIPHQWQSLASIFTVEMWFCILATYTVSSFFYWLFGNVFSKINNVSPVESMLAMFGILTLTSWAVRTSNSSGRQLVTWWCVFVMMLTATYSSSIAARLTLPKYEARIDTVQQLVELDFHWYDVDFPVSDKWSSYFNPDNYWKRQFKLQFYPLTVPEMLPALNSRKFAFPIQQWGRLFMNFHAAGLDYEKDLDDMRVMKETTEDIYEPLMQMYEAGLTMHWTSEIVRTNVGDYSKRLLEETDVVAQTLRQLTMDNLHPAFYILSFGLLNSLLVFLGEVFYYRYKKKSVSRRNI